MTGKEDLWETKLERADWGSLLKVPMNKLRSLRFICGLMGATSISEGCGMRKINLATVSLD